MNEQWRIFEMQVRQFFSCRKASILVGILLIILAVVGVQLLSGNVQGERSSPIPAAALTEAPSSASTTEPAEPTRPTPAATSTVMPSPTSTVELARPSPPASTPVPTRPLLTPASTPALLHLLRPEAGAVLGAGHVMGVTFGWEGTLQRNQVFRVIVRHMDPELSFESPDLTTSTWSVELTGQYIGECRWRVEAIQNQRIVARSEERHFWFDPFPGPGSPAPAPLPSPTP